MRYGFILPRGDVWTIPEMAAEAEAAGWDGVFVPDCISIETPNVPPGPSYDPWILLALMGLYVPSVCSLAPCWLLSHDGDPGSWLVRP
jgi:hypothetical protein